MAKRAKKYGKWLLLIWVCIVIILMPVNQVKAITKTETSQPMEWTKITNTADSAGIVSTGSFNVANALENVVHIDWCLAQATAHEGTEIIVQIASEAGVNDAWTTLVSVVTQSGTPTKADFKNNEAADQTVLGVTDPVANNIDHNGKFIFLEDTSVPANCEIAYQISNTNDVGDTITVLDGITFGKDTDDDVWSIDGPHTSIVDTYAISIPASASQARVIFNNFWDDDGTGADGYGRVRVTKLTAL